MNNQHTYAAAGVDISKAEQLTQEYAQMARSTRRSGLVGEIGSFAGLFDLAALSMKHPLLVSSTDGVGTKLLLAHSQGQLDGIGQDLVAMCVNDILCCGAEPLFFLDYFACGSLDAPQARTVVKSIAQACSLANCALLGGETAEMPGMYRQGEFDLAGFCVGAVEAERLLDAKNIAESDIIVALASSGVHSNGFSLIRKLLDESQNLPENIHTDLLVPTTIYTPHLMPLLAEGRIRGLAHITGGGLSGNLARIVPKGLSASVQYDWQLPGVFEWIARAGGISRRAMLDIFNCGVGMTAIVAKDQLDQVLSSLQQAGLKSWPIGVMVAREGDDKVIINE